MAVRLDISGISRQAGHRNKMPLRTNGELAVFRVHRKLNLRPALQIQELSGGGSQCPKLP